jgi:hypothetical protein
MAHFERGVYTRAGDELLLIRALAVGSRDAPSSCEPAIPRRPKRKAEAELDRRVFVRAEIRKACIKRRRVLYREGSALVHEDRELVNAKGADMVILLAPDSLGGAAGDMHALRAYEALKPSPPSAILEFHDFHLRFHAFLAAGRSPREDRWVDAKLGRWEKVGHKQHLPSPPRESAGRLMLCTATR